MSASSRESTEPTVILHFSDIHRTPDEPATNAQIILSLTADFSRHKDEGVPAPHVVVLSGDAAQSATTPEYAEAQQLLTAVLQHFELPKDRLVIVPGNHDVNWTVYQSTVHPVEPTDSVVPRDLLRDLGTVQLAPSSESEYARRLDDFRSFYSATTGRSFPVPRNSSFVSHVYDDASLPVPLGIVAFSSVDTNDKYHSAGKISPDAILAAKSARAKGVRFQIAVWHHDTSWPFTTTPDFLQLQSLQFISQAGFDFALCGHTHRPGKHAIVLHRDLSFPLVNAGTLCAGPRQRAESIPRSYNIIEVHADGRIRVHVRVKETLGDVWRDHAVFGNPHSRCAWYEFRLGGGEEPEMQAANGVCSYAPKATAANRQLRTGPAASPFREYDARAQALDETVRQYVWLETSSRTDSDEAQVIVGTRGSGKTSLLSTLTPQGRLHHADHLSSPPLRRLAFVFPLKIHQISGLSGRGWISIDERADLFRAILGAGMARAFVICVVDTISVFTSQPGLPTIDDACGVIGRTWFPDIATTWDVEELLSHVDRLYQQAVSLHSERNPERRRDGVTALSREQICTTGLQFVVRAAEALAKYEALRDTHWIAAFDEADFLNERQQPLLYELLGQKTQRVAVKIATLPYAHSTAIQSLKKPLVPGDDYEEVAIALSYARTSTVERPLTNSQDDRDDAEAKAFETIAHQIWDRRLRPHYDSIPELSEMFPAVPYEDVVSEVRGVRITASDLQLELIGQLSSKRQAAARKKSGERLRSQFLRKYRQPFRFRTAHKDRRRLNKDTPLYWGLSNVVRACDGNCRAFLQVLEVCWRMYWAKDGLRPLSASEQHNALSSWAASVRRKARAFGERGVVLNRILENLADAFLGKLHKGYLTYERFRWSPSRPLNDEELEAVLIGIAHGMLSPELDRDQEGVVAYPTGEEMAVRLGFPIAVAASLPLRGGGELSVDVGRMIQLGFPGWE